MITLHQVEQGSKEWLEMRSKLYTGSNAHKLLGSGGQSLKVVDGVVSAYALAGITGFTGNFYTRRGHILEDEAIEIYEATTGRVGIRPRVGFVTNSKYPSCGYSPDDLHPDRTIECKAFNPEKHMKIFRIKRVIEIPIEILAQAYFGMLICGKRLCDLVIYNPDLEAEFAFKIITIRWNPAVAANLRRILAPKVAV